MFFLFTSMTVDWPSYPGRSICTLISMMKLAHVFIDPFKLKQEHQKHYKGLLFLLVFHTLQAGILSTAPSSKGFKNVCFCENSSKVKSLFLSDKHPFSKDLSYCSVSSFYSFAAVTEVRVSRWQWHQYALWRHWMVSCDWFYTLQVKWDAFVLIEG